MKTFRIVLILVLAGQTLWAQHVEFGAQFNASQPVGTMSRNMSNAFGMSLDAAYRFDRPVSLGLEVAFGNYGRQTTRQQYTFDDGSVTETNVNVNNNITSMLLTGKHFLRPEKRINPYLSGKAGWTWFATRLTIEDPEDETDCHPLESVILSKDNSYIFSGGAGARIDFRTFFKKSQEGRFFFDVSFHTTHGGIVRYMNVKRDHRLTRPDQDVMARFINTQTQVVHEHHVGYLYSSVINMFDYRIGVIMRPGFQ